MSYENVFLSIAGIYENVFHDKPNCGIDISLYNMVKIDKVWLLKQRKVCFSSQKFNGSLHLVPQKKLVDIWSLKSQCRLQLVQIRLERKTNHVSSVFSLL